MNNRVIGRIISINHNNVTAELTQNLGSYITLTGTLSPNRSIT